VAKPKCPICNDTYWLYDEFDGEVIVPRKCICLERKLLKDYLGPEIYNAKWVKSELYRPILDKETGKTEGDRTEENLFIKGTWAITCQHLRWVLSAKRLYSPGFTFEIVTDDRLVRVWLGMEAYKNRSTEVRNSIKTNNSLLDLLSDASLTIIRLGFVKHNKAAPDVLYEALKVREDVYKPTWIVEGAKAAFVFGHCAYSNDVNDYIQSRFKIIDLGGDVEAERQKVEAITREIEEIGEVAIGLNTDAPDIYDIEGIEKPSEDSFDIPEGRNRSNYRPKGRKGGGMSDLEGW
jgi:hypothetical protein